MQERSRESAVEGREAGEHVAALTDAAAQLREAIDGLTAAVLRGTAVEKATARDRFEAALAAYTARLDET